MDQMADKIRLRTLYAAFVVALAACGGGGDGEGTAAEAPPTGGSPAPTPAPSPAPSPSPAPAPASAAATLQWTAPSDSRVQGYRVYYGLGTRAYLQAFGQGMDTGTSTTFSVSGLEAGQTYYFAVTAYDSAGNESDYSAEVAKQLN